MQRVDFAHGMVRFIVYLISGCFNSVKDEIDTSLQREMSCVRSAWKRILVAFDGGREWWGNCPLGSFHVILERPLVAAFILKRAGSGML